jgi:glycosyltransferase involved in cell wall biosynthesis
VAQGSSEFAQGSLRARSRMLEGRSNRGEEQNSGMNISIIIASYNRASALRQFLQELDRQIVPEGAEWEVLIVDNNSSDETRAVAESFATLNPQRFKYVFEGRRGKSLALNAGIQKAAGEILVFTDDDCVPNSDWLACILDEFASDSSLSVVGGRVELYNQQDKPVSIRTCRERKVVSSSDLLFSLLIGCNMSIRRTVFDVVMEFDPFLGPGTKMGAVFEDVDFLYRAFKRGLKLIYSPKVLVYHNHGRRTDTEIQALNKKYAVGRGAFYCKHILSADRDVLRMAYWEVSSLARTLSKELFAGKAIADEKRILWALLVGAGSRLVWNPQLRRI